MSKPDIKIFALYGEFGELDNPDFVHIETIASRSRLYDGDIRPHVHNDLFQLIHINRGQCLVTLEKTQQSVIGPCVISIPPGTVHGFLFEPDTEGNVLTLAGSLPLSSLDQRGKSIFQAFYEKPFIIELSSDTEVAPQINQLLHSVSAEHAWPRRNRTLMLEWLVQTLFLRLYRKLAAHDENHTLSPPGREVLNRFRTLIENHYREHWDVSQYAQQLGLTEHHLTRLCRAHLHKTPLEIVQRRVILEAERKLIYTIDSISLIAYDLGFKDPAYFSRLFKRKTGATPINYRRDRKILKDN